MESKYLQKLGLILAVPLMLFAVHENLWAEPLPEQELIAPAFTVTIEPKEEEAEMDDTNVNVSVEAVEVDARQEYELELMARDVEAEAGNQSLLGKRLVADTILNRVDHPGFPDSIKGVIYQEGQFSTVKSGAIYTVSPTQETMAAVIMERMHRTETSVIYFNNGGFTTYGTPYERVGDHYFSK